jgi:hypothetical protein
MAHAEAVGNHVLLAQLARGPASADFVTEAAKETGVVSREFSACPHSLKAGPPRAKIPRAKLRNHVVGFLCRAFLAKNRHDQQNGALAPGAPGERRGRGICPGLPGCPPGSSRKTRRTGFCSWLPSLEGVGEWPPSVQGTPARHNRAIRKASGKVPAAMVFYRHVRRVSNACNPEGP